MRYKQTIWLGVVQLRPPMLVGYKGAKNGAQMRYPNSFRWFTCLDLSQFRTFFENGYLLGQKVCDGDRLTREFREWE